MKPTEEQMKTASSQQLAEWSAVWVMGYKKEIHKSHDEMTGIDSIDEIWFKDGKWVIRVEHWNPAKNIGQAWELWQKIAMNPEKWMIFIDWLFHIGLREITARDITQAALLAISDDR